VLAREFTLVPTPIIRASKAPNHRRSVQRGVSALARPTQDIQLWLVDLASYPWQDVQTWLSAEESQKALRFRFEHDRRRYRASHCAVRELLSSLVERSPQSLEFRSSCHGKPQLVSPANLVDQSARFNLSHSGDLALFGLATKFEVGVDIEQMRAIGDIEQMAEQHFTESEQHALFALPPPQRSRTFLRGWTRKEACLKALGCGLALGTHTIETGLGGNSTVVVLNGPSGTINIHLSSIDVGPDALAAVAWIEGENQYELPPT
jgi:4'-phosphopantetheinyl transferase